MLPHEQGLHERQARLVRTDDHIAANSALKAGLVSES